MDKPWHIIKKPSSVFCVAIVVPRQGEDLRGVFSTLDKANTFAEALPEESGYLPEDIAIWEFELDGQFLGHANKDKFNEV